KLNTAFDRYRSEHEEGQEEFEASVDVIAGVAGHAAYRDVESRTSTMIRSVRGAEDIVDELRKVDRAHPAIALVEAGVPMLVKRAQAWKTRSAERFEYAQAIGEARRWLDEAEGRRAGASSGEPHDAIRCWPEALTYLRNADAAIARAAGILADDHDEAD